MPFSGYQDINEQFAESLRRMIADRPGLSPYSGYRSPERQAQLYNAAVKKYGSPEAARKWVAPPGKSRHGSGQAVDLAFASLEDKKWAHENAKKYGLQFRLGHEPWHIEPIGARGAVQTAPAEAAKKDGLLAKFLPLPADIATKGLVPGLVGQLQRGVPGISPTSGPSIVPAAGGPADPAMEMKNRALQRIMAQSSRNAGGNISKLSNPMGAQMAGGGGGLFSLLLSKMFG